MKNAWCVANHVVALYIICTMYNVVRTHTINGIVAVINCLWRAMTVANVIDFATMNKTLIYLFPPPVDAPRTSIRLLFNYA